MLTLKKYKILHSLIFKSSHKAQQPPPNTHSSIHPCLVNWKKSIIIFSSRRIRRALRGGGDINYVQFCFCCCLGHVPKLNDGVKGAWVNHYIPGDIVLSRNAMYSYLHPTEDVREPYSWWLLFLLCHVDNNNGKSSCADSSPRICLQLLLLF